MARSETERALATTITKLAAENKDLLAACKRKDEVIVGLLEYLKKHIPEDFHEDFTWIAQTELDREGI